MGGRQYCRLSICEYWLSWTNTVSEQNIPLAILTLKRGPCLFATTPQMGKWIWKLKWAMNPQVFIWKYGAIPNMMKHAASMKFQGRQNTHPKTSDAFVMHLDC